MCPEHGDWPKPSQEGLEEQGFYEGSRNSGEIPGSEKQETHSRGERGVDVQVEARSVGNPGIRDRITSLTPTTTDALVSICFLM